MFVCCYLMLHSQDMETLRYECTHSPAATSQHTCGPLAAEVSLAPAAGRKPPQVESGISAKAATQAHGGWPTPESTATFMCRISRHLDRGRWEAHHFHVASYMLCGYQPSVRTRSPCPACGCPRAHAPDSTNHSSWLPLPDLHHHQEGLARWAVAGKGEDWGPKGLDLQNTNLKINDHEFQDSNRRALNS